MKTFDELQLRSQLAELSLSSRTAFATACAERLLGSYRKYSARTGRGDPGKLQQILDGLWEDLLGVPLSMSDIDVQIEICTRLMPREDDRPWIVEQAAAEDAAAALAYALRCRKTGSTSEAAWAARRAYEATDQFVVNHEDIDTNVAGAEARVLTHPIVQTELARQQRDLHELSHGLVAINQLRDRAKQESTEMIPF
jgi:uncharacterized protein YjaG (DUF416 family)